MKPMEQGILFSVRLREPQPDRVGLSVLELKSLRLVAFPEKPKGSISLAVGETYGTRIFVSNLFLTLAQTMVIQW
ncbi:hypothetical protein AXA65_11725 [Chryseobacterium sp. FP211-J200]|nr:hypothetical protein AXA65_11725 [Chryseobacterium sp. FP211-J200]